MYLLLNFLLLPPVAIVIALAYVHLFGGPLEHHYLYCTGEHNNIVNTKENEVVAIKEKSEDATKDGDDSNKDTIRRRKSSVKRMSSSSLASANESPASASSSSPSPSPAPSTVHRSSNLRMRLRPILHLIRLRLLGANERTMLMRLFRFSQKCVWRAYKRLMRQIVHTGELERMIMDSGITMVPLGNCIDERVGFHPHLVSLSVRISAYLRSSTALRQLLLLDSLMRDASAEDGSALVAGTVGTVAARSRAPSIVLDQSALATLNNSAATTEAARPTSPTSSASDASSPPSSTSPSEQDEPGDGDEDETPFGSPMLLSSSSSLAVSVDEEDSMDPMALGAAAAKFINSARNSITEIVGGPASPRTIIASLSDTTSVVASASSSSSSSAPSFPPIPDCPALDDLSALSLLDRRSNHLLQLLVGAKRISRTGDSYSNLIRPVLYRALVYRAALDDFLRVLELVLQIPYSRSNPAHERWLGELWEVYLPLGASHPSPPSRVGNHWNMLGFQGDDPASDFRGMGVLGLRNLIEFGRLCPIQSQGVMAHSQAYGLGWFGFAIGGINVTADLVCLAREHVLDGYFAVHGATWNSWHALYASVLTKFDERWLEAKPASVMSFSSIHGQFLLELRAELLVFPFALATIGRPEFNIQNAGMMGGVKAAGAEEEEEEEEDSEEGESDDSEDESAEDEDSEDERRHRRRRQSSISTRSNRHSSSSPHLSSSPAYLSSTSPFLSSRSISPLSHSCSRSPLSSAMPLSRSLSPASRSRSSISSSLSALERAEAPPNLGNIADPLWELHPALAHPNQGFERGTRPNWREEA